MRTTPFLLAAMATGGIVAASLVPVGAEAAGATLIVGRGANCPGATYTTIQSAVDAASTGDTIQVCAGTYPESVTINTSGLTLLGAQHGKTAVGRTTAGATIVTTNSSGGEFTIAGNADDTTIDGFILQGGTGAVANGVNDFAGSSGLTLVNNLVKQNLNGINLQNPDGSQPATIARNSFQNNNAGGVGNDQTGSGVFISNGPGNATTISNNAFATDSQTAINTAGDSSNRSVGLNVHDNTSTNDSTFVVATNSQSAVIQDNTVTTSDAGAPGGHGTGILDFGNNIGLRIAGNSLKVTGTTTSMSSGISSSYLGDSQYTDIIGNTVSGYYNDIKAATGNTTGFVYNNKLSKAVNDGIIAQPGTSNVTFSHNAIASATVHSCEDQTSGSGTAGTANLWLKNSAPSTVPASSPPGICGAAPAS